MFVKALFVSLEQCKEQGKIENIPEIPGVLVFKNNHVGVYIGNGEVIEARGVEFGIVKTQLKDRGWTSWGMHPGIDYSKPVEKEVCPYAEPAGVIAHRQNFAGIPARWYQWYLVRLGYDCGVSKNDKTYENGTDGYAQTKTWNAIESVTKNAGLGIGAVGQKTRNALKEAYARK